MSWRRNGLRKQVTEAEDGPWELRSQKGKSDVPRGKRSKGKAKARS